MAVDVSMAELPPCSTSPAPPAPPAPAAPVPPAAPGPPSRGLRLAIALLTVSLFGCDHATKIAAEASLSHGRAIDLVSGVLELRYAANDDTAFSLLRTFGIVRTPSILIGASFVALLAVAVMWIAQRKRASRAQHVGFALVLAGALGNVIDRAVRGYVVDFIHVTRWPVFNVADIAVVAGAILLMLCALAPAGPAPPPRAVPPAPPAPS